MTLFQAELIVRLSEHGLDVAPTARVLYMHPNTLKYHIRKIKRETGKNPRDFYDMCALLAEAKAVLKDG